MLNHVFGTVGFAAICMFQSATVIAGELATEPPSRDAIPTLFRPVTGMVADKGADDATLRVGASHVSLQMLDSLAARETKQARLTLFDDVDFVLEVNRVEFRSPDSYSVGGSILGADGGTAVFVREGAVVLGNIWTADRGSYEIRAHKDGDVIVRQINMAAFPSCAMPDDPEIIPLIDAPIEGGFVSVDGGSVIKVMVVFTPASVAGIGGSDQMLPFAQMTISTTNQAYLNSGINTSVVLVGAIFTDYQESGNSFTDRNRLTDPNDGFMDEIHDIRNQVGADVVSLIVQNISACGRAHFSITFGNVPNQALGFNVVRRDCAIGNLTFPHELGHNQGSRHDRAADPSNGAFAYSHGFIAPNAAFRTIMGTSNLGAPRIPFFSNPDVSFGGQPTGVSTGQPNSAHNAMSISQTALNVANFRTASGDLDGDGAVNSVDLATLLASWGAAGGGTNADLNSDGIVNSVDLATLLANWTG